MKNPLKTPLNPQHRQNWRSVYVLSASLCCILILATSLFVVTHMRRESRVPSTLAASARGAQQVLGIDPNMLEDPATYDTRPCVRHPSAANCNSRYPVTPMHVSPALGVRSGAGACIDTKSRILESQPLTDSGGQTVGTLQLWWSRSCNSYFAYVSFSFALDQVTSAEIWIQTESTNGFVQWFDQVSSLPPTVTATQDTGPVAGSALTSQELYSPLIFAPSDPTSAHIDIQLGDGSEFANGTASYGNGVEQYNGVA